MPGLIWLLCWLGCIYSHTCCAAYSAFAMHIQKMCVWALNFNPLFLFFNGVFLFDPKRQVSKPLKQAILHAYSS
jgi:hypothetical protein